MNNTEHRMDKLEERGLWLNTPILYGSFEITQENNKYIVRQFTIYDDLHQGNYDEMSFSTFEKAKWYVETARKIESQMIEDETYQMFVRENFPICQERGEYYGW